MAVEFQAHSRIKPVSGDEVRKPIGRYLHNVASSELHTHTHEQGSSVGFVTPSIVMYTW